MPVSAVRIYNQRKQLHSVDQQQRFPVKLIAAHWKIKGGGRTATNHYGLNCTERCTASHEVLASSREANISARLTF